MNTSPSFLMSTSSPVRNHLEHDVRRRKERKKHAASCAVSERTHKEAKHRMSLTHPHTSPLSYMDQSASPAHLLHMIPECSRLLIIRITDGKLRPRNHELA